MVRAFFRHFWLFNPQGIIALKERNLLLLVTILMLIVVVPVFFFVFYIVWKYRASKNANYDPNWDRNKLIEGIWWGIPLILVIILSVITWQSSYDLSPYKPIASAEAPITIQVVALDWKWLFIYPQQGIATVNYVEFPAGTPINFELTSDAPMNSFWIPDLGGQMYAMPGMSTDLHLEAFKPGNYDGLSANISGAGFAGMKFVAHSVSQNDFDQWLATVKQSPNTLTLAEYNKLAAPSQNNPLAEYSSVDSSLYMNEVMKYMSPQTSTSSQMNGMIMNK